MWFFLGEQNECEFIGLKPLSPDHIIEYGDSYYSKENKTKESSEEIIDELKDEGKVIDKICVDTTPELPEEFKRQICVVPNNKFLSRGEKLCRETMEKIYGVPFKNTRPSWLRNITGRCLELDCYNEKLKLAVEYSGESHYKYPNYFHKSYDEFKDSQRRDKLKSELCKKQGVHLIVVPFNISFELIPTYIMYHLPEIIQKRLKNEQIIK